MSIKADDVVVRNVRITCPHQQRAITIEGSRTGIVVEDSEIDGAGSTQVAIGWGGYTLRRVDVHGVLDGPRLGSGTTVEDSWVHDMVREDGFHSDALQSNGGKGIVVRHNTLMPKDTSTGDVLNSAIQLGAENDSGTLSDVTIEDNYLDDGNYSVNVRDDDGISGVVLRGNVFGTSSRYGPVIAPEGKVTVEDSNTTRGATTKVETVEP
nr:right-handed parallel beta-helix repeat-containing protein [Kineococcus aurantiacus]